MAETATDTVLNAARVRAQLSYAGLAAVLGVGRAAAFRYCQGLRVPRRGKDGKDGPAERMERWSGGKIHLGNFAKPAAAKRRQTAGGR